MNLDRELIEELAPTGSLRVAINYGNPVLAQRDPQSGEPRGVSPAIARELAARLGLAPGFVTFDAAGKVFAALAEHAWDVAFLAIDPKRAQEIDFTPPYVIIEGAYMVRSGSPLRGVDEVDRPSVRVAVGTGSAYELHLSRTLKQAELVRFPTGNEAIERFLSDGLEVAAGVKSPLQRYAAQHPGLRVMEERFMAIEQAMGVPKGRSRAVRYLARMLEELKASGFVAGELERSGQGDALVAPPAALT